MKTAKVNDPREDVCQLEGHSKSTLMSINDLVAYLVGWGQLVLKWNDKKSKGLAVDFPETGFKWNELGLLAQKFYKDFEKDDFKTLNTKLDKTTTEILKLIMRHWKRQHDLFLKQVMIEIIYMLYLHMARLKLIQSCQASTINLHHLLI